MRYFIALGYKGTHYHGWQYQPNAITVQETINKSLSVLLHKEINVVGAGRTDAGVHAKQMYAHFDTETSINSTFLVHKLNSYLPKDIVIYKIIAVHNEAHARFDATKRSYEYHIHQNKNAFEHENGWYYNQTLDLDLMNEASKLLLQHHNFKCFSKTHTDVNTYNCTIFEAFWKKYDTKLVFTISADRFLRNMVRAIVGTLLNIGLKKITLLDFEFILISQDRKNAGFSVPACGLYLTQVVYPYL